MTFLTVGYVSGFIALAVFTIQIFLPDLITLIIVDRLRYKQSAATWSVASGGIQEYLLPSLLRSDSAASKTVNSRVKLLLWLSQSFAFVLSIAAIVTPLGLYNVADFSQTPTLVPFTYAKDFSNVGKGTRARPPDFQFRRECVGVYACPDIPDKFDRNAPVPQTSLNLYESGLSFHAPTVSSIFDIQWRRFKNVSDIYLDHDKGSVYGGYQQLQTYLPRKGLKLFEGLVVNYDEGGIGFRNHTVPDNPASDAEWEEDLLFLEPETACVDTNLTLQHYVDRQGKDQLLLVDRGGFIHLPRDSPGPYYGEDTQSNPELLSRAWKAAWWNNYITMVYLNVTTPYHHPWQYLNTFLGKTFALSGGTDSFTVYPYHDTISTNGFGSYIPDGLHAESLTNLYPNPFNITTQSFTRAGNICRGAIGADLANITNIAIGCGLLNAVPRVSETDQHISKSTDGKVWETSLYSCANAVKASLKTVTFRFIASRGSRLSSLKAVGVRNKQYQSASHIPHWGVENYHVKMEDVNLLWGLVDKEAAGAHVSLLQSERLYLPGSTTSVVEFDTSGDPHDTSYMNLPGVDFYLSALKSLYRYSDGPYTAYNNPTMARRWKELTTHTNSSAKMLDLMWTDMAANAVYGSRGWLSVPRNFSSERMSQSSLWEYQKSRSVPIHLYTKEVRYRWLFSIPAFVAIGGFIFLALLATISLIFGSGKPSHIAEYLDYVSAGRLMGREALEVMQLSTKDWIEKHGHKIIDIRQVGTLAEKG